MDEVSKQTNTIPFRQLYQSVKETVLMLPRAPSTILPYSAPGAAAEVSMQVFLSILIDRRKCWGLAREDMDVTSV